MEASWPTADSLPNFGFWSFFGHLTLFWISFGDLPYCFISCFFLVTFLCFAPKEKANTWWGPADPQPIVCQNFGFLGFFGHLTMFWTRFGAPPYCFIGFFDHIPMFCTNTNQSIVRWAKRNAWFSLVWYSFPGVFYFLGFVDQRSRQPSLVQALENMCRINLFNFGFFRCSFVKQTRSC